MEWEEEWEWEEWVIRSRGRRGRREEVGEITHSGT